MAWTAPVDREDGDVQPASVWNAQVVENIKYLKAEFERYYDCTQTVTAKTAATVYQNTTSETRVVTVTIDGDAGALGHAEVYVEAGDATPDLLVAQAYTDRQTNGTTYLMRYVTMTFVVPINSYYQVDVTNCTIEYWVEWDLY